MCEWNKRQNQKISYETRRSGVYKEGKPTQMATELLAELIKIGDTIEFTFKGNTFTAKILRGGLIGKCQQQTLHEDAKNVLTNTVGFSSLTAWTESCLQDLLEELLHPILDLEKSVSPRKQEIDERFEGPVQIEGT